MFSLHLDNLQYQLFPVLVLKAVFGFELLQFLIFAYLLLVFYCFIQKTVFTVFLMSDTGATEWA